MLSIVLFLEVKGKIRYHLSNVFVGCCSSRACYVHDCEQRQTLIPEMDTQYKGKEIKSIKHREKKYFSGKLNPTFGVDDL